MRTKSFANRLSWTVIGVVSTVFLLAMSLVAIVSHQIIADEATRSVQHILHGTISDIEKPLNEVEISTQTVAAYMSSMTDQPEVLQSIARRTVEISDLINGCSILFFDKDGNIDPSHTPAFSYRDSTAAYDFHPDAQQLQMLAEFWTQKTLETKTPSWTAPYPAFDSRQTLIATYCYPLMDADLNVYAIVAADLSVDWMEQKVEELRPYENSLATIVCGENCLIGLKDTALVEQYKKSFIDDKNFASLVEDIQKNKDSLRKRVGKGRNMSFVVYGPLHNGWNLSILCPYRDVLYRSSQMHAFLIIIGVLGLIVLFFVCRHVIRKMTKPITQLSDSALNMAKGNFKAQLPEIKSEDEMLTLHDSFVFLQNSIADYIEELKATTSANERMESELNVARNIQMGMLHRDFPPMLHALLIPAKEVGGDLYDYILKDGSLYFAIGDVSGKGVPASLMMAITSASLRFVSGLNLPLNQTLERINNGVSESNSHGMFVTLFVGRLDLSTGHLEYCNAGHNPILVMPPDAAPYLLKAKPNLAIGLMEGFGYEAESIDLKPGTRIVAYTDGVTEAERPDLAQYGVERLLQWARDLKTDAEGGEKAVVESLYDSVKHFAGDNPQNDDITIVSLKFGVRS